MKLPAGRVAAVTPAQSRPHLRAYGRQTIDHDDIAAVVEVLKSDFLTVGPATERFEQALGEFTGARFVAAVSSGTAALHLAALGLGIGPGDFVIVPSVTFLATANAVRLAGGEVIFADVQSDTGLMGAAQFEAALDRAPRAAKAVFPVHLMGQCMDVEQIARIAGARGMHIVDDACHAIGTSYYRSGSPMMIGSCADCDATVFSFHPVKTVTSGEGGAVATNDPGLFRRISRLRSHGMSRNAGDFQHRDLGFAANGQPNPWYYEMAEVGFNYRSSDIHSALGLAQLRKLGSFVQRRRELVARYRAKLAPLAPLVQSARAVADCEAAWHLFVVLVDFESLGLERSTVMNLLYERGIGSQVHYLPVHMQPYYRQRYGAQTLPGAERYYARALSLPLFPGMAVDDVDIVVDVMSEIVRR